MEYCYVKKLSITCGIPFSRALDVRAMTSGQIKKYTSLAEHW